MKKFALLAWGYSGEYKVSIKSAHSLHANLDPTKFELYTILISPGRWYYPFGDERLAVDKNDFSIVLGREQILFDAAFMTVHGIPGEDCKVRGYLDMIGLPYDTGGAATSATTMNKAYNKQAVQDTRELFTAKSVHLLSFPLRAVQISLPG